MNALPLGTPVEMFKFRSISGAIVICSPGPVSWKSKRRPRTSLSSCEAEVRATACKLTIAVRNFSTGFTGVRLGDTDQTTNVYNDNGACVKWHHNLTTKSIRHTELKEISTREWVHDKLLDVLHVPGKVNISDIFTKEIRDRGLFCCIWDSFMCRLRDFARFASAAA